MGKSHPAAIFLSKKLDLSIDNKSLNFVYIWCKSCLKPFCILRMKVNTKGGYYIDGTIF